MKFKSLGTAVATAALLGAALTGTVATAGTAAAATLPTDCSRALVNVKPKETVNLRTSPKKTATAVGIWAKGAKGGICNDGKSYKGGSYTACGKTSNQWYYGGPAKNGWVPKTCFSI